MGKNQLICVFDEGPKPFVYFGDVIDEGTEVFIELEGKIKYGRKYKEDQIDGEKRGKIQRELWSIEQELFMGMHAIFESGD